MSTFILILLIIIAHIPATLLAIAIPVAVLLSLFRYLEVSYILAYQTIILKPILTIILASYFINTTNNYAISLISHSISLPKSIYYLSISVLSSPVLLPHSTYSTHYKNLSSLLYLILHMIISQNLSRFPGIHHKYEHLVLFAKLPPQQDIVSI